MECIRFAITRRDTTITDTSIQFTAGPRLRRIFGSSRAPASDVAGRLPRIFGDHNLAAFREMVPRSRQNGRL